MIWKKKEFIHWSCSRHTATNPRVYLTAPPWVVGFSSDRGPIHSPIIWIYHSADVHIRPPLWLQHLVRVSVPTHCTHHKTLQALFTNKKAFPNLLASFSTGSDTPVKATYSHVCRCTMPCLTLNFLGWHHLTGPALGFPPLICFLIFQKEDRRDQEIN